MKFDYLSKSTKISSPTVVTSIDNILPNLYVELRKSARAQLSRVNGINTINTTALVHEVYLKLVKNKSLRWDDDAHFMALAAKAMRHILINYAQKKQSLKRGARWHKVTLNEFCTTNKSANLETILAINRGIESLSKLDNSLARLVEMRFFAGLNDVEIAQALGVTERTVRRNWKKAKALLALYLAAEN